LGEFVHVIEHGSRPPEIAESRQPNTRIFRIGGIWVAAGCNSPFRLSTLRFFNRKAQAG
jgi:hypothetical protein